VDEGTEAEECLDPGGNLLRFPYCDMTSTPKIRGLVIRYQSKDHQADIVVDDGWKERDLSQRQRDLLSFT
jgi:hypothetical protein